MSFNADLADMAASIDAELGEPASWTGVSGEVRVHFEAEDEMFGFGAGQVVSRGRMLRVHRLQVSEPSAGDLCVLSESAEMLRVIANSTPRLDRDGYWACEVESVQP